MYVLELAHPLLGGRVDAGRDQGGCSLRNPWGREGGGSRAGGEGRLSRDRQLWVLLAGQGRGGRSSGGEVSPVEDVDRGRGREEFQVPGRRQLEPDMVSTWKLLEAASGGDEMGRGTRGGGQVAGIGPQGGQRSWRGQPGR